VALASSAVDEVLTPYLIQGPALISLSGGRTSGYMLHEILDAHGGTLPSNVHVTFCNTGDEDEGTLRFVHEIGARWGVHINWIERDLDSPAGFREVGLNSADRTARPLEAVIRNRQFLPNGVSRFCTVETKIIACRQWMRAQGYKKWLNVIGLRKDEPKRVRKKLRQNAAGTEPYINVMPLNDAIVGKGDVRRFWRNQPFDLGLPDDDDAWGNCRGCHLKPRPKLLIILLRDINALDWWIGQEAWITGLTQKPSGARFRKDGPTYAELKAYVQNHRTAAEAEVAAWREAERIKAATPDLFEQEESLDCACTD
jgi:3'-phosphoadenosine 5'-phosphosulfate sulfotransferase (PAPS reductase)/FAD synthetase